jgi:DNA (cytosine-5)-methyltransferase 1
MADRTLKFRSLFSGCGGFDLGFTAHGFRSQGAYDSDSVAVENFVANVGGSAKCVDLTSVVFNK